MTRVGDNFFLSSVEIIERTERFVYRIHAETLEVTGVFRFPDHLGGIVHDVETGNLHAVSWGSRRLYSWDLDDSLNVVSAEAEPVAGAAATVPQKS